MYEEKKRDGSMKPHERIPGGYTNNEPPPDGIQMDKINLDRFLAHARDDRARDARDPAVVDRARARVHEHVPACASARHALDHVDRMDTHPASAADRAERRRRRLAARGAAANGEVGEVFLLPGQLVLYEGAWLRHGRPMRLKGDEFANVFSHFKPLDWDGPKGDGRTRYHGVPPDRSTTLGDMGITRSNHFEEKAKAAAHAAEGKALHEEL